MFADEKIEIFIMKAKNLFSLVTLILFSSSQLFSQNGQQLFRTNCAACHSIGKGKLTGPDLMGVDSRYDETWMLKWIKSSQSLVKAKDEKAVKLFNNNNKIVMPDQSLKEDEIKAVLAYIKTTGDEVAKNPVVSTPFKPIEIKVTPNLLTMFSFTEYMLLFLMVLVLVVMWVMVKSIRTLLASRTATPELVAQKSSERKN
jgi:cytochrome c2